MYERPTHRPRTAARLVALAWIALAAAVGCAPKQPPPYNGPTKPLAEVVAAINANNQPITTLWARHTFQAWVHDKGREHYVGGDGNLLLRKPGELYVKANNVAGTVFELGVNDREFWMSVVPEVGTQWWGRVANIGKPCARPIPIRPDLILAVLGVSDVHADLLQPPVPLMRFNNDERAYMLTWAAPAGSRWAVQREVWYDYKTLLPRAVLLFDGEGRVIVRAYLSEFRPVDGTGGKVVAGRYDILFPDTKDRLVFQLSDMQLKHNGIPREGSIRRRPIEGVREVQIDEECGD